jgi:signal peptidase I
MGLLTGALYACLIAYLGGWYVGQWTGNFSLLLFILTVVTLAYWLAERFHFKPARERASAAPSWPARASRRWTATSPRPASGC